jgi:subtilase family serine protease
MSRRKYLIACLGTSVLTGLAVAAAAPAGAAAVPAYQSLPGSVPSFAASAAATGAVAGSRQITIQVWMKPNLTAAESYAASASTPGTSAYRHYLSPDAYAARFGPAASAVAKVETWLTSQGFTGIKASAQRSYVRATGDVSQIEAAFRTQLENYRSSASLNADGYQLYANDRSVSVPASLSGITMGVTGLDNASPILPLESQKSNITSSKITAQAVSPDLGGKAPCSGYYGQETVSGFPEQYGTTTFPTENCGYDATQLRGAYGATFSNDGSGQTIALVELGLVPDMFQTLQDYANHNAMPAPSPSRYAELSLGEGSACGNFDIEEQLDVEASYDMAPGANQLVVGGDSCNDGDFGDQGLFDADIAVLGGTGQHPLASVASNSWEVADEDQPPLATEIEHTYLVQAADEGVGMYFSAGDGSGVLEPSADPYAIGVGGTTLGISQTNSRLFETGWSTGYSVLEKVKGGHEWVFAAEQGASGGGPAVLWKEPSYQKGVVPPAMTVSGGDNGRVRSAPDISADADPFTGFAVGMLVTNTAGNLVYVEETFGGTSEASPLVAGMVTAAQQGQPEPFGFINPAIYRLVKTSALYDTLPVGDYNSVPDLGVFCPTQTCGLPVLTTFDDQSLSMPGYTGQVTQAGYDNMTGVGVPNGAAFISALRA